MCCFFGILEIQNVPANLFTQEEVIIPVKKLAKIIT